MKKLLFTLGMFFILLLAACSSGNKNVVNVYNWESYLPEDVQADFTRETGIKLNYEEFDSNETMLAKIRTGASYDVTFPSAEFVPVMMDEGMIVPIDMSKIPNLSTIDVEFLEKSASYDPGNQYAIPYNVGSIGIMYWKDMVPNPQASYAILGDPQYKGRVAIMDDVREVYGAALVALGYSTNSTNPEEIEKATNLILRWKANILKFDNTQMASLFASKEVWIVLHYPENILTEMDPETIKNVGFFIPREGSQSYFDNMVLLKNGKNRENAHIFINYILRPDIMARICDAYGYPGISSIARELQTGTPYYSTEELKALEIKMPLGDKHHLLATPWEERIKIGQ